MTKSRTPVTPVVDPAWTPRQQEVLALLAKGYTNGQIAQRLGITLDGAKFHVREILSKLGVDSREDAAAYWRQRDSLRGRLSRAKRSLLGLPLGRILAGGAGAAVVVALAALALLLFLGGDDEESAALDETPTNAPTVTNATPGTTPTATATRETASTSPPAPGPFTINGVEVRDLIEVDPTPIDGFALYINTGCIVCDPPGPGGIARLFRSPDGILRQLTLVQPPEQPPGAAGYVTAIRHSADMEDIALSVCSKGTCGMGAEGASNDAESTMYRSGDGGVTWTQVAVFPGDVRVTELAPDDLLVTRYEGQPLSTGTFLESWWIVGGPVHEPRPSPWMLRYYHAVPVDGRWALQPTSPPWPMEASIGPVSLDESRKRLLHPGGDVFFELSGDDWTIEESFAFPDGVRTLLYLQHTGHRRALAVLRGDDMEAAFTSVEFTPAVQRWGTTSPIWWSSATVAATWSGPHGLPRPVLLDFEQGTFSPFEGPFWDESGAETLSGRNQPLAVIPGPFARVTGAGTCLNVREEPSTTAAIRGCYADGVLLRTAGETQTGAGIEWLAVTTPAGDAGWASTEYLEY